MQVNQLKRTLKAGSPTLGTLVWEVKGRGVVHTLAQAGMDFIMICTEHSAYNLETVVDLVAQAHAAGITPVVRIPDLAYEHVTRLLDTGCQSLIVPHVKTGAEVRRFIELAKYHPEGKRGMAIYLGASTEYEDVDPQAAMTHANANTLLGVLVETKEAVENIEEILIPGIDLVLVGFQDLAHSFGIPGQYDHPKVRDAMARVQRLSKERGIATAAAVNRPEQMQTVVASGAQYLLYGTDLVLMRREAQRAAEALAPFRTK
jgi:2-dehydro-3-deoxyglucarate aldolase/4-hydroxy-2-oxoheptanedioate aldolase